MKYKFKNEQENWKNYFYNIFPELMTSYYNKYIGTHDCNHHNIRKDLALIGAPPDLDREKYKAEFFICWFGLSLIDQVLHRNNKEYFEIWNNKFKDHPIPMKGAGMGCISHASPTWLLKRYAPIKEGNNKEKIKEFLIFLDKVTRNEFKLINLEYNLFVSAMVNNESIYADKSDETKMVRNFYLRLLKNN